MSIKNILSVWGLVIMQHSRDLSLAMKTDPMLLGSGPVSTARPNAIDSSSGGHRRSRWSGG
jgi:hypothetical protein